MRKPHVCAVTAVLMATLPVYAQTGGMNNSAGGASGGSIPGSMGSGQARIPRLGRWGLIQTPHAAARATQRWEAR